MTQAVSGCGGGSSRDRTPRWTTLMWRKTIARTPTMYRIIAVGRLHGCTIQCHQVVLVVELGSQYSFRIVWQKDNEIRR